MNISESALLEDTPENTHTTAIIQTYDEVLDEEGERDDVADGAEGDWHFLQDSHRVIVKIIMDVVEKMSKVESLPVVKYLSGTLF